MQIKRQLMSAILGLIIVAIALAALQGQSQRPSKTEQYDDSSYPVTDYAASEPVEPEQRLLRHARGRHHNNADPVLRPDQIQRFTITELSESGFGGFPTHAKPEPALPVAQSDAIIKGEVTQARAYLSQDKTDIYSEFDVALSNVFSNRIAVQLFPNSSIIVERSGGAVRFASGKIVRRGFDGKPLPRLGRRYLMFLKYIEDSQDYSLITAYELQGGKVFPLDGLSVGGSPIPELAQHQKYGEESEGEFLAAVREAIARLADK